MARTFGFDASGAEFAVNEASKRIETRARIRMRCSWHVRILGAFQLERRNEKSTAAAYASLREDQFQTGNGENHGEEALDRDLRQSPAARIRADCAAGEDCKSQGQREVG